jgi:hypothetical protein
MLTSFMPTNIGNSPSQHNNAGPTAFTKIVLTGAIAAMVGLALEPGSRTSKAALCGAGVSGLFASSVMVVAGTRNHLNLLLGATLQ